MHVGRQFLRYGEYGPQHFRYLGQEKRHQENGSRLVEIIVALIVVLTCR